MTQTMTETAPPLPGGSIPDEPVPEGNAILSTKRLTIYEEVARRSEKLGLLLKGTGVSAERLIHVFQMELYRNPKLQNCHKDSLLQALMRCAEMGLMPGFGVYLIPYNGTAQVQVGLQGWLIPFISGRGVGRPDTSPFGTHRALFTQWARDETIT